MRRRRGEGTVTKRKDGRFEVAAYVDTPTGARRVRRYTATRVEAEALLVDLRRKNQNGLLTDTRERKVGDYLDHWLATAKLALRPSTYVYYESIVRVHLKPWLGQKYLTKLTVADVQSYLDGQLNLGKSVRTIQKERLVLSAALKRAAHEELVIRNVASLTRIPKYSPKEVVPWNLQQLRVFLDHAGTDPFYPIFVLLAMYGLRTSEALGLSWSDIDVGNNVIHVRQQLQYHENNYYYADLKTQAGRRELPLLNMVNEVLKNVTRSDAGPLPDLVFKTSTGMPVDRGNLRRSFQRISRNAGLPVITLHHLRHTAATNLKNLGIPARDTQLILGHAHITTTQQIYQHSGMEERQLALERYEEQFVSESVCSRQIKPSGHLNAQIMANNNSGRGELVRVTNLRLMSPVL
jgi:integrase